MKQKLIMIRHRMKRHILNDLNRLIKDESGVGVIELVLILVVLIGLVAIFKDRLNSLLNGIFSHIQVISEDVY